MYTNSCETDNYKRNWSGIIVNRYMSLTGCLLVPYSIHITYIWLFIFEWYMMFHIASMSRLVSTTLIGRGACFHKARLQNSCMAVKFILASVYPVLMRHNDAVHRKHNALKMEWAQATKKQLDMTLFYFVFCIAYNHVAGAFESRALFFIAKNDCGNSITRQNIGLWMLVMFTRWGQSTLTISREKKIFKTTLFCLHCLWKHKIK